MCHRAFYLAQSLCFVFNKKKTYFNNVVIINLVFDRKWVKVTSSYKIKEIDQINRFHQKLLIYVIEPFKLQQPFLYKLLKKTA